MRKRFARAAMDADQDLTFGSFSLDCAGEQLVSDGEAVALTPKDSRPVESLVLARRRARVGAIS